MGCAVVVTGGDIGAVVSARARVASSPARPMTPPDAITRRSSFARVCSTPYAGVVGNGDRTYNLPIVDDRFDAAGAVARERQLTRKFAVRACGPDANHGRRRGAATRNRARLGRGGRRHPPVAQRESCTRARVTAVLEPQLKAFPRSRALGNQRAPELVESPCIEVPVAPRVHCAGDHHAAAANRQDDDRR